MRKLALGTLLLILASPLGFAQTADDSWDNLKQLRAGQKIEVVDRSLKVVKGKFVRFSEADITLLVEDQEVVIPKEQVYRVSRKGRGRNALIGLAVGGGAGVIVAVASPELGTGKCAQPWPSCVDAGVVSALGFVGAAIGTGIGAAIPPHTSTVYRAEIKPRK